MSPLSQQLTCCSTRRLSCTVHCPRQYRHSNQNIDPSMPIVDVTDLYQKRYLTDGLTGLLHRHIIIAKSHQNHLLNRALQLQRQTQL